MADRRYTYQMCECGNPDCAGCEDSDQYEEALFPPMFEGETEPRLVRVRKDMPFGDESRAVSFDPGYEPYESWMDEPS